MKKYCLLLLVWFSVFSFEGLSTENLRDIEVFNLKVIKEKKGVINYRDQQGEVVYKIWEKGYNVAPRFLRALQDGFFDDLTPLTGLIYDHKECRGYTSRLCKPLNYSDFTTEEFYDHRAKRKRIAAREYQSESYNRFIDRLLEKTRETGYFHLDLTPMNIVKDGDDYLIIDLESVESLSNLYNKSIVKRSLMYAPQDYVSALHKIYKKRKK